MSTATTPVVAIAEMTGFEGLHLRNLLSALSCRTSTSAKNIRQLKSAIASGKNHDHPEIVEAVKAAESFVQSSSAPEKEKKEKKEKKAKSEDSNLETLKDSIAEMPVSSIDTGEAADLVLEHLRKSLGNIEQPEVSNPAAKLMIQTAVSIAGLDFVTEIVQELKSGIQKEPAAAEDAQEQPTAMALALQRVRPVVDGRQRKAGK